jgi:DNA-binding response OmpR family regulator
MEGLVIGAVDYIHKPIVAPLLLQRIKMHFDMTENQRKALIVAHDKEEILERMRNEIRSPLNDAIDAINLAVKENDIQTIKNHLEKALGSSKNALGVVNSILDAPKAEADKTGL